MGEKQRAGRWSDGRSQPIGAGRSQGGPGAPADGGSREVVHPTAWCGRTPGLPGFAGGLITPPPGPTPRPAHIPPPARPSSTPAHIPPQSRRHPTRRESRPFPEPAPRVEHGPHRGSLAGHPVLLYPEVPGAVRQDLPERRVGVDRRCSECRPGVRCGSGGGRGAWAVRSSSWNFGPSEVYVAEGARATVADKSVRPAWLHGPRCRRSTTTV